MALTVALFFSEPTNDCYFTTEGREVTHLHTLTQNSVEERATDFDLKFLGSNPNFFFFPPKASSS